MTDKSYNKKYKKVFAKAKNFYSLLHDYVDEEWINKVDCDSLEIINKEFTDFEGALKQCEHLIYKAKLDSRDIYFYLALELQKEKDFALPLKLLYGMTELIDDVCQNTVTEDSDILNGFKMPMVMPVVLCNGLRSQMNSRGYAEFQGGIEELGEHRNHLLDFKYLMIDIQDLEEKIRCNNGKNILSFMFDLDRAEDNEAFVDKLTEKVQTINNLSFEEKEDFIEWARISLIERNFPVADTKKILKKLGVAGETTTFLKDEV